MIRRRAASERAHRRFVERSALRILALALVAASCGKSGPPLPPLHLVPEAVSGVVARRTANEMRLTFVLPTKNANGPGAVELDRVEIYAATVAAGATVPANRELLTQKNLVGTIEVRQPVAQGVEEGPKPADDRPGPGEPATFVEVLDERKLTPTYTEVEAAPRAAAPATPAAAPAPPVAAKVPRRIYSIRGVTRRGRPGQPAARIELPLGELPPPPAAVTATFSESAVALAWTAPPVTDGAALQFNVYTGDAAVPLNGAPLAAPAFERAGVEFGKEECFVVRSVTVAGAVSIESAASERACVTPTDIFPPGAPKGLSAVAGSGVISLIWDTNADADLAGYLVLRGVVPGDALQPLTATPIKETTFRDTTVQPGVRYVYAIVAVDTATPANTSAPSARVEETARQEERRP